MPTPEEIMLQWRGHEVLDSSGETVGKVEEIYLDAETDKPEFALVGLSGLRGGSKLVPLAGAVAEGDKIRVQFEEPRIKGAPDVTADTELSQAEEQELYAHYGLEYGESRSDTGLPEGSATDSAMTRSEEELRVGKAQRQAARARLRKHIVTEQVQTTVPVQREELRIEREPITGANVDEAASGPSSPRRSTRWCSTRRRWSSTSAWSPRSGSASTRT